MNYFRHSQNRRRRKLPHVQRKQHESSIFWPSFHGALSWMRKNQETIDTAVKLLEIYPSLIQDRSLDVLWDFLHPFFATKTNTPTGHSQTSARTVSARCIPSICVTECVDTAGENVYGMAVPALNLPKISVVGDPTNGRTNFLRLVKDIDVFVLSSSAPVHESDACIFLMTHENISSKACYRDLVLARTLDIPTLFVKPPGFVLPSPLPDAVIQFALFNNSSSQRYRKHHCGGSARMTKPNQQQVNARSGSSLQHTNNTAKHPLERQDSDLIVLLIDGYRKAVEYDPENHDVSVKTLKKNIEQVTKMNLSSTKEAEGNLFLDTAETTSTCGNFLSVPDPDASISWMDSCDTEFDEDMLAESIDSSDLCLEGRSLSELSEVESEIGSLEKETFYFVSNNKHASGKVVKWPPTSIETHSEISSTSSDTPINFCNLDFDNFQTQMDLFDSDSTPEIT